MTHFIFLYSCFYSFRFQRLHLLFSICLILEYTADNDISSFQHLYLSLNSVLFQKISQFFGIGIGIGSE